MQRRHVLLGVGAAASGSALIGTGAFSRVESHRDVTVEVAEDPDAYLGMSGTGSLNSENYVEIDENGHLAIDISDSGNEGEGVNSDSKTWFDSMVQVCNQGKEGVGFYIQALEDDDLENVDATDDDGEPRLQFYTGEAASEGDSSTSSVMGDDNAVDIPVGECIELGLRTNTKGVDASDDTGVGQLISDDDDVTLIADVELDTDLERQQDPVRNANTREGYATIQAAVDDADEGETIEVLTGTEFEEDVDVETDGLTIEATSNSKPVIEGEVRLFADDLELRGFEIVAPEEAESPRGVGLNGQNTVVAGNTIKGFLTGTSLDWASGTAEDTTIENNEYEDNTVGIGSTENVDGLTVDSNTFTGNEAGSVDLGGGAMGVLIEDNTFEAIGDGGIRTFDSGPGAEDIDVDSIADNSFEGDDGTYVFDPNDVLDLDMVEDQNTFDPVPVTGLVAINPHQSDEYATEDGGPAVEQADDGTLYLIEEGDNLDFDADDTLLYVTDGQLGISAQGTGGNPAFQYPVDEDGDPTSFGRLGDSSTADDGFNLRQERAIVSGDDFFESNTGEELVGTDVDDDRNVVVLIFD